ncbi:retrovirus-related Pol polyprotein from transposon 297 [Nephila pilipes]|uniref:Retrovirus-related Pol polyprotein from transposon 297 n=1 Tax=Nephila pilipes TaxID=299642 RepID=A0A8X6MSZ7_NEPPI|nr:retrovirus-related Pol polyprotein from transposon 297 [Nephila pilipes]
MGSGLMSLAYAECPLDIRESLAAQYFVDAIRDEDTQLSTRLMDAKGLKSALAYSMKYEAARTVSKSSKHVRYLEAPVEGLKISALSEKKNGLYLEGTICGVPCLMLVDTGANVTLLRTVIAQKLNQQFICTASNIFLKTATGEKAIIHGKLDASNECGSRRFQHEVYVTDITDPCILGLDFLRELNLTVDLERNEIRTGGEEIPLFSANTEFPKLCSVFAKEKTVIPA